MPIIVDINKLNTLKKELLAEDNTDIRNWTEYKCKCGHHCASDINFDSLHCLKCNGDLKKIKVGTGFEDVVRPCGVTGHEPKE